MKAKVVKTVSNQNLWNLAMGHNWLPEKMRGFFIVVPWLFNINPCRFWCFQPHLWWLIHVANMIKAETLISIGISTGQQHLYHYLMVSACWMLRSIHFWCSSIQVAERSSRTSFLWSHTGGRSTYTRRNRNLWTCKVFWKKYLILMVVLVFKGTIKTAAIAWNHY